MPHKSLVHCYEPGHFMAEEALAKSEVEWTRTVEIRESSWQ